MSRPAVAHIRLDAFRHNYRVSKQRHGGKALAVIKANAYGHGAVQCAQAIADEADGFAVACLEEALQLRQAGIKNSILLKLIFGWKNYLIIQTILLFQRLAHFI